MLLPIFACLVGCGRQLSVSVDAAATPEAHSDMRFTMVTDIPHIPLTNPDYVAISKAVARALTTQGFEAAKSADDSNLVVVIDWLVGDPKVHYRHIGADAAVQVSGAAAGTKGMPAGGTSNAGSFGFGTDPQDGVVVNYLMTFTIKGVDRSAYLADPAAKPLWSIVLSADGETDSAGVVAPQMVAAGMPYITQNAGKQKVRLGATQDEVKYVRGDIQALPAKKP
jgi:hypothetical protein